MRKDCQISAEIIADSKNTITGDRITSFIVKIPRIVLAEFNTHRMISRNSASSRAIPFEKMLEKVSNEPFIPMKFQKDHKGMQGTEYFEDETGCIQDWLRARDNAVDAASIMSERGLTKQLCNRLLEPFMYHTIICTATEWANFMALRAHPAAEIHIAKCAELMLDEMNKSTPKDLQPGEWHIPFGDRMDDKRLDLLLPEGAEPKGKGNIPGLYSNEQWQQLRDDLKIKIATARCARVSYDNYEGGDDYEKDIKLHDRLSSMGHWSPFEHCAQTMSDGDSRLISKPSGDVVGYTYASGNFKGFTQYRKTFEGENKSDERLIIK